MKFKFLAAFSLAAILFSCDDETTGIGQFIVDNDLIPAKASSYTVETNTYLLDSVYSRSSTAYLGKFTDQEYGTLSSDFLVQINCPENFELPENTTTITRATLGLYYTSYFGDSLATLRVQVDPLTEIITDDGTDKNLYYSNIDPTKYYNPQAGSLAVKDYSAFDRTVSDSLRSSSGYYPHVSIDLGDDFCRNFLEKYNHTETDAAGNIVHPYFKDSEAFISNVLKGFYIHTTSGEGSILYIADIYLHLTLKYDTKTDAGKDTTVTTIVPMASTKEVFMSSRFENANLDSQLSNDRCTYLKSPAGLCTEVTLPIEEMYRKHRIEENDSLNAISVDFQKMKDTYQGPYKMGTPSALLLVRKSEMKEFFENNKVYDSKTSFLATYNSSTGTYSFSKLNRLVSHIFSEIAPEIEKGETEWNAWKNNKQNQDWNKVLLVPVTTETDSQGNVIGVENDLSVNSAMLVKGEDPTTSDKEENRITMSVVYTQPELR